MLYSLCVSVCVVQYVWGSVVRFRVGTKDIGAKLRGWGVGFEGLASGRDMVGVFVCFWILGKDGT